MNVRPYSMEEIRSLRFERQLDIICDRFEDEWKGGRCPSLREFAKMASPEYQRRVLRELILIEKECITYHGDVSTEGEGPSACNVGTISSSSTETHGEPRPERNSEELPAHFDKFAILSLLGRGCHGVVYEAEDVKTRRRVALKVATLSPTKGLSVKSFEQEATNTIKISHPSVVRIWEVGESRGIPYMASELVFGKDLNAIIESQRLSDRTAIALVADIASGVHAAHMSGIIHRDLKPSNILIESRDPEDQTLQSKEIPTPFVYDSTSHHVRIVDFGVSKRVDRTVELTQSGEVIGTPHYMSPEQAKGLSHRVDARSDIFSLGVLLFQLLTGRLPFQGDSFVALGLIRDKKAPLLRSVRPDASNVLEEIVRKCLSREPIHRYQTVGQLEADLREWLSRGQVEGVQRHSMRRRLAYAVSVAATIAICLGLLQSASSMSKSPMATGQTDREFSSRSHLESWIEQGNVQSLLNWSYDLGPDSEQELQNIQNALLATETSQEKGVLNSNIASPSTAWRLDLAKLVAGGNRGYSIATNLRKSLARSIYQSMHRESAQEWARLLPHLGKPLQKDLLLFLNADDSLRSRSGPLAALMSHFHHTDQAYELVSLGKRVKPEELASLIQAMGSVASSPMQIISSDISQYEKVLASEEMFESEAHAKFCARLGLLAYCCGDFHTVDRVISFAKDPRARSHFLLEFPITGLSIAPMVERLEQYQDDWKSTAVLTCLCSIPLAHFEDHLKEQCTDQLLELFDSHASAGAHSAAKNLLVQWGHGDYVRQRQASEEFRTLRKDRNWYVNSVGMQMNVIRGPREFIMGGLQSDPAEGFPIGPQRIDYSYAIAERMLTDDELLEIHNEANCKGRIESTGTTTFFDAECICHWLSSKEQLCEDCEYRIPSTQEWECASRLGTVTDSFAGNNRQLGGAAMFLFHPNGINDLSDNVFQEWTSSKLLFPKNDRPFINIMRRGQNSNGARPHYINILTSSDRGALSAFRYARSLSDSE